MPKKYGTRKRKRSMYGRRRRTFRKRKRFARRSLRNISYSSMRPDYTTVMAGDPITLSNDTLIDVTTARTFALNNCPSFGNWSTMFDQYRIISVVIAMETGGVENVAREIDSSGTGATYRTPALCIGYDIDDSTVPSTFAELSQRSSTKTLKWNDKYSKKLYPKPLIQLYNGGFTGYCIDNAKRWIDVANAALPHYPAIKIALQSANPAAVYRCTFRIWYKVAFKNRTH